jgi:hypothetical protein
MLWPMLKVVNKVKSGEEVTAEVDARVLDLMAEFRKILPVQ